MYWFPVDERALEKAGELSPEVLNALRVSSIDISTLDLMGFIVQIDGFGIWIKIETRKDCVTFFCIKSELQVLNALRVSFVIVFITKREYISVLQYKRAETRDCFDTPNNGWVIEHW